MNEQEHFLTDILETHNTEPVSVGLRLADGVIDFIAFYALCYLAGMVIGMLAPEIVSGQLSIYFITYMIYLGYYTVMEGSSQGRTIGKFITGCRAVKYDGSLITWKDAGIRSISRIVPFEALSALNGYPWHDKWSGTVVVKNKTDVF